ncbi:hypothetical protein A33M_0868 [Rhodovulum sp. PH10]|uniref:hypothetical protein n=1 Tax=Rhodovulum sp. PH10 TaxID=1187851 RepID=UPI00027C2898|nr:hypothetical protein [Rhodovulum sp. PH10]EJW13042.1 hypothetical protein A33M_0868 [Rhodovulum sp. PH10]
MTRRRTPDTTDPLPDDLPAVARPKDGDAAAALPRRFPVGTRLVVEGEPDPHGVLRIVQRYLVMPNGRRFDLPPRPGSDRRPRVARKRASAQG